MHRYVKSPSGWPRVEISQSSTATMRGSLGCTIVLSSLKSPWMIAVSSPGGIVRGSQSLSASIAACGRSIEA